jgi:hypothetical protein
VIRAHVADHSYGFGVAILIADRSADGVPGLPYRLLHIGENGTTREWEEVANPALGPSGPTLTLEDGEARALLDALMRYYHGAEDTRALRRDYDDERKRVDRLTTTLGDVVKGLVSHDAG